MRADGPRLHVQGPAPRITAQHRLSHFAWVPYGCTVHSRSETALGGTRRNPPRIGAQPHICHPVPSSKGAGMGAKLFGPQFVIIGMSSHRRGDSYLGAKDRSQSPRPSAAGVRSASRLSRGREVLARHLKAEQWSEVAEDRWVLVEEYLAATWSCKAGRAPGLHGLVVEVWQNASPEVVWILAAGLNQRLKSYCGLLAKIRLPWVLKYLRPIALQSASARIWPRLMLARFEAFNERLGGCSMGFKRGHLVRKVSLIFRLLRDRCLEWGKGFCALHLEFAAGYDSGMHTALRDSMVSGGVPLSKALWYIRETRASLLMPSHGHWRSPSVAPERGLK